jgi:hypothetical protein
LSQDFYFTGGQVRIFSSLRSGANLSGYLKHIFGSGYFRDAESFADALIRGNLNQTGTIPQFEENEIPVISSTLQPSG